MWRNDWRNYRSNTDTVWQNIQGDVNRGHLLSNLWFNQVKQPLPQCQLSLLLSFPHKEHFTWLINWLNYNNTGSAVWERLWDRLRHWKELPCVGKNKGRLSLMETVTRAHAFLSNSAKEKQKGDHIVDAASWLHNTARRSKASITKKKHQLIKSLQFTNEMVPSQAFTGNKEITILLINLGICK